MIFSSWFFWILLWVPVYYGYKAINQFRNIASMAGMGSQQDLSGAGYGNQQQGGKKKRKKKKKRGY